MLLFANILIGIKYVLLSYISVYVPRSGWFAPKPRSPEIRTHVAASCAKATAAEIVEALACVLVSDDDASDVAPGSKSIKRERSSSPGPEQPGKFKKPAKRELTRQAG